MDIVKEIEKIKKEKDFVILAHYYVDGTVQEIADFVGDSYYLSKKANEANEQNILFCGVVFMGESAKILNPEKHVIMPDMNAGCPMAHMTSVEKIEQTRAEYDDLCVVCYINSTAEIKAHSDVCVTSSNAVKIVSKLKEKNILFIPDNNLGTHIAKELPDKNFIYHDGYCCVHHTITEEELLRAKKEHPNALVLMHPECQIHVTAHADYIGSTSGIINYATESDHDEFIIGTEEGILYQLKKNNPDKKFYPVRGGQVCNSMKLVTLEKVLKAMQDMSPEVTMDEELRKLAMRPLLRMHELAD